MSSDGHIASWWRRIGNYVLSRLPNFLFGTALLLLFTLVVVPETARKAFGLPATSPTTRLLLSFLILVGVVGAGWILCFGSRSYFRRPKYVRYLVQSVFLSPVLFGLVVFILFAYVHQMREIYLGIIDDREYVQGVAGLLALLLLCAVLGCWQRYVGEGMLGMLYNDHGDLTFDKGLGRVLDFKGSVASILPLLGLFAGLFGLFVDTWIQGNLFSQVDTILGGQTVTNRSRDTIDAIGSLQAMKFAMGPLIGIALGMSWLVWWSFRRHMAHRANVERAVMITAGLVAVVLLVLPPVSPDRTLAIARALGPLAVIALALAAFAAFFSFLSLLAVKLRAPVTGIFLVFVACYLAAPLFVDVKSAEKDTRVTRSTRTYDRQDLHTQFTSWLAARTDRGLYEVARKPYPVFIFAMSGGGIYATSAAATFLAEVQDDCANFSHHVFTISGVSGGAVGSSIFNGLANATAAGAKRCERVEGWALTEHTERIVRTDHLSPVVSVIVSDVARKIPVIGTLLGGARPDVDRASMLERSFIDAFSRAGSCTGLKASDKCIPFVDIGRLSATFSNHWHPTGPAPALILNTTWSETGYRVAFAPFALHANSDGALFAFNEILGPNHPSAKPTLIQAAMVSARFPGVVPAWPVDMPAPTKLLRWNFVDGGYVDNSGSTTALEIYQQLQRYVVTDANKNAAWRQFAPNGIDVRLIVLTDAEPARTFEDISGSNYSDTMAPLSALLNVRSQLSNRAISQTIEKIAPGRQRSELTAQDGTTSQVWLVNLEQDAFPLPLGWKISGVTNNIVGYLLGRPALCQPGLIKRYPTEEVTRAVRAVVENSCVKKRILEAIRAEPTAQAAPSR